MKMWTVRFNKAQLTLFLRHIPSEKAFALCHPLGVTFFIYGKDTDVHQS